MDDLSLLRKYEPVVCYTHAGLLVVGEMLDRTGVATTLRGD